MRTPDQTMGALIGVTAGAAATAAVVGAGVVVSAGAKRVARRNQIRLNQAMDQLRAGLVLGDRGDLEHRLPLHELPYLWGEKDLRETSKRSPWLLWFGLPLLVALILSASAFLIGGRIPADAENADEWMTVLMVALVLPLVVGVLAFPIAQRKDKRRSLDLFLNSVVQSALPAYWKVREAVRTEMAAGRMTFEEALYHLNDTWLGHYYRGVPAIPMTWTMNASSIAQ